MKIQKIRKKKKEENIHKGDVLSYLLVSSCLMRGRQA